MSTVRLEPSAAAHSSNHGSDMNDGHGEMDHKMKGGNYARFFAMIGTSTAVMYVLMYLNTYSLDHVWFSETRLFMAFYMGAAMTVIMLAYMLMMYKDERVNKLIFGGSIVVFALALWLVRSQVTVGDQLWMKAMIPHHSIAIMTSERANIDDERVRTLANEIILAQRREIKEMEWLIEDIGKNGKVGTKAEAEARKVPEFEVSLTGGGPE